MLLTGLLQTPYSTNLDFNNHEKEVSENTVGSEKNAVNEHFLIFPQCFLPYQSETPFVPILNCRLQIVSS